MKGVIIAIILLVFTQAWRVSQRDEVTPAAPVPLAESSSSQVLPPSPRYERGIPSEGSVEFMQQLKPMHDPWKHRTDPDHVWERQRQRASELLIRFDMPALDK